MFLRLATHKHTLPSWGQSSLWTSSGAARLRGVPVWVCVCMSVWECVCVCVQAAALPETLVHLLSLSPAHGAVRQTSCATLLSVTLAAISLSPLHACLLICSLSSTGDIIHATEGEKEGSLSSAPERLQHATAPPAGEPRTKTYRGYACIHDINCT